MLNDFLEANRAALIERCKAKVALRPVPRSTKVDLAYGIPVFLAQLIETLRVEKDSHVPAMDASPAITASARKHGDEMMHRGFTIDQVVHDYGDLCQAITELAAESATRISADDFQVLNRCLDDAIADAITEFQVQRDRQISSRERREEADRLGSITHQLRDLLGTAALAFRALKSGAIGTSGATSAVLERSLAAMAEMIGRTMAELRLDAGIPPRFEPIPVDRFIAETHVAANLAAAACQCDLEVSPVESAMVVRADRQLLHSAVSNLLNSAFRFAREHGLVSLKAFGAADRVLIEVRDKRGGVPEGKARALFASLEWDGAERLGLDPGLSIARRAVEAMAGSIRMSGAEDGGCAFTIDLPRHRTGPETIRNGVADGAHAFRAANDESSHPGAGGAISFHAARNPQLNGRCR